MDYLVNLLLGLNTLLGGQLGLTMIVLGVGVRVLFFPLFKKQQDHAKKMQTLQPKLKKLKDIHGDDKVKFAQEQQKLFKESGVNPAAGCLPMLVQMVVFIFLYRAIYHLFDKGLNTHWLWWDLAKPDTFTVPGVSFALPGILILLAAGSQLLMSKMMMPNPVPIEKEDKLKEVEEKTDLADDLQKMQGSMIYMFPLMFVFFGYRFPAGLALYWSSSTIMTLYQQYRHSGWGGLAKWLPWIDQEVDENEEKINKKTQKKRVTKQDREMDNFVKAMKKSKAAKRKSRKRKLKKR